MKTEINVQYALYGDDLHPDEITQHLALSPSKTYKKGEPIKENGIMTRLEGCWEIETGYAPSLDINDALNELVSMLKGKTDVMKKLKRENHLESKLTIVIRIHENEVPGMYFSPSLLSFIANDLEAEMDICTYIF